MQRNASSVGKFLQARSARASARGNLSRWQYVKLPAKTVVKMRRNSLVNLRFVRVQSVFATCARYKTTRNGYPDHDLCLNRLNYLKVNQASLKMIL